MRERGILSWSLAYASGSDALSMTPPSPTVMRRHAESIWRAGVEAVRPQKLIGDALARPDLRALLTPAQRIIVVGAGKAGAAMRSEGRRVGKRGRCGVWT